MRTDLYAEKKRSNGEKDRTENTDKESLPHIKNLYEPAHRLFRWQQDNRQLSPHTPLGTHFPQPVLNGKNM
jgi:hypothetical protein